MPCSCKLGKSGGTKYVVPTTRENRNIPQKLLKDRAPVDIIHISPDGYKQLAQQIDTGADTSPQELCLNCVRKHIGLAYLLCFKHRMPLDIFAAAGQLMCASLHLQQTFPNYSKRLVTCALCCLRPGYRKRLYTQLSALVKQFEQDIDRDLQSYTQQTPSELQKQTLLLSLIYGLLFVQVPYYQLNKTWATAYLSQFAYRSFNMSATLDKYQLYRPLWKLIQSMKLLDDNYIAARDYIQSLAMKKLGQLRSVAVSLPQFS